MARVPKKKPEQDEKVSQEEHQKELGEELHAIYAEDDGEIPDLSRLDTKKGSRLTRYLITIIVILALVAGAAFGGFFLWRKGSFQDTQILKAEITGPDKVLAGEEVFFEINYENIGSVPIAALEAKLNLPSSFELTNASPEPTDESTWNFGSLTAGSDGTLILSGIFHSEVPNKENIQVFFTYKPANFSSSFEDIQNISIELEESVLELKAQGPEKALSGDEIEYTIELTNNGEDAVTNSLLVLEIPDDFTVEETDPVSDREDVAEWSFEEIKPGATIELVLKGQFTSQASGEQKLKVKAYFEYEGERLTQAEQEVNTDLLAGTLSLGLIVDGTSANQTAELGETLLLSIDYANNSEDALEGLKLELVIEPAEGGEGTLPIDFEQVLVDEGVRDGSTFSWDQEIIEGFENLTPTSAGVIDLSLPLNDSIDLENETDKFTLRLEASMDKIGNIESPRTIEISPITISINSDLDFAAGARYYDTEGAVIGDGPMPPKVQETSKFQINWSIDNTLHELTEILATATLPQDVTWTGNANTDIGSILYDDTTRLISWEIDKLPLDIETATVSFELAITPEEEDVGSFFKLINATSIEATDFVTQDKLSGAVDILTTELAGDDHAKGQGVVVE